MGSCDELELYIDAFMRKLTDMLEHHEGKYTVFRGDEPLGFWDTWLTAFTEGVKNYGNAPMLVREVSKEYVQYGKSGRPKLITRLVVGFI